MRFSRIIALSLFLFYSIAQIASGGILDRRTIGLEGQQTMIRRTSGGIFHPGMTASQLDLADAPEGFGWYTITESDANSTDGFQRISGSDREKQLIFQRVNALDRWNLSFAVGKRVLVPYDAGKARQFVPVPVSVTDRGPSIHVDTKMQTIALYELGSLVFWTATSTGFDSRTPSGSYTICSAAQDRNSAKYGGRMPYSLQLRKVGEKQGSGMFIHLGFLVGTPASHGCVRVLVEDAEYVYRWAVVRMKILTVRIL